MSTSMFKFHTCGVTTGKWLTYKQQYQLYLIADVNLLDNIVTIHISVRYNYKNSKIFNHFEYVNQDDFYDLNDRSSKNRLAIEIYLIKYIKSVIDGLILKLALVN